VPPYSILSFALAEASGASPLASAHIADFGPMISDRHAGPFRLQVERIGACR
jgi:hypothetical protein